MKLKKGDNHKYGYVERRTGQWLIPPMYECATAFTKFGIAIVALTKGRKIIINKENKNVTGKIYETVEVLRNGYMRAIEIDVKNATKNVNKFPREITDYAFLKPNGEEIVELRHAFVLEVTQYDTVEFTINDKYGVYNLSSGKIIPAMYGRIFDFYDDKEKIDYAVVYNGKKYGLIDWNNNIKLPFEYEEILPYKRFGVILVKKDELFGVIDFTGEEVYPFEFSAHTIVNDRLCLSKKVTTYIEEKTSKKKE